MVIVRKILHISHCEVVEMMTDYQGDEAVQGAWYPIRRGRKGAQDEVLAEKEQFNLNHL